MLVEEEKHFVVRIWAGGFPSSDLSHTVTIGWHWEGEGFSSGLIHRSPYMSRRVPLLMLHAQRPHCSALSRRLYHMSEGAAPGAGEDVSGEQRYERPRTEAAQEAEVTADVLTIVSAHEAACRAGQDGYTDPQTGYFVFTRLAHLRRGKCCGSACRHCPFGQENVKDSSKKKQFNSFFYI